MTVTNEYKAFKQQMPSDVQEFICVIISSADTQDINLVKGSPFGKTFAVDGLPVDFEGSGFDLPNDVQLLSDDGNKGNLTFNRVGRNVRDVTKQIGGLTPVYVRILKFLSNQTAPQFDKTLMASSCPMNDQTVSIGLGVPNYAKATQVQQIFTAEEFRGLENV